MTTWEHSVRQYGPDTLPDRLEDVLADAGRDGWELVHADLTLLLLIFKRPGSAGERLLKGIPR
ncbi:hypothetical protein [Micrococcus luteus]|uniref:hypothetical protein n=1 Tax=Micrococcus luteus TaxID=1270 RepID=UPI00332F02AD